MREKITAATKQVSCTNKHIKIIMIGDIHNFFLLAHCMSNPHSTAPVCPWDCNQNLEKCKNVNREQKEDIMN